MCIVNYPKLHSVDCQKCVLCISQSCVVFISNNANFIRKCCVVQIAKNVYCLIAKVVQCLLPKNVDFISKCCVVLIAKNVYCILAKVV